MRNYNIAARAEQLHPMAARQTLAMTPHGGSNSTIRDVHDAPEHAHALISFVYWFPERRAIVLVRAFIDVEGSSAINCRHINLPM